MLLPKFEYHEPSTLEEALKLLSEMGGNAKVLAGWHGSSGAYETEDRQAEPRYFSGPCVQDWMRLSRETGTLSPWEPGSQQRSCLGTSC